MDATTVGTLLSAQMRSLYSLFTTDDISAVITFTQMELGWTLPVPDSVPEQCFWFVNRAHRHLLNALCVEASNKFDYKQAKLSNRFTQMDKKIAEMDDAFFVARDAHPSLFYNYKPVEAFGTYAANGFVTDSLGRSTEFRSWLANTNFFGAGSRVK